MTLAGFLFACMYNAQPVAQLVEHWAAMPSEFVCGGTNSHAKTTGMRKNPPTIRKE